MARRDDEEQLPSSNDIASSSNGTTSNLLLSLNNPNKKFRPASSLRLRRYSGDGNDLHDQKRQCVRIVKTRVEIALSNNEFLPVISSNTINSSSINRIVTPDIMREVSTGCGVCSGDMVEEVTCDSDMVEEVNVMTYEENRSEWSGVTIEAQCENRVWNFVCEQERFINITINTSDIIGREWRYTIYVQVCKLISTQQIPMSMISAAFAMLDRYHNRELLEHNDFTLAFMACFIFAVEINMSHNIFPMIASNIVGTCSITQLIDMGERIRKFFLTAAIGNEYGCSPLNTTEYSQPIIPEQLIHTLELYDISNLLGVDCRMLLDQAKHVASIGAL